MSADENNFSFIGGLFVPITEFPVGTFILNLSVSATESVYFFMVQYKPLVPLNQPPN